VPHLNSNFMAAFMLLSKSSHVHTYLYISGRSACSAWNRNCIHNWGGKIDCCSADYLALFGFLSQKQFGKIIA